MAQYPEDGLKSFANRLAEIALSADGARAFALLQVSGLLVATSNDAEEKPRPGVAGEGQPAIATATNAEPDRVGIWERESGTNYFVRRLDRAKDWHFWANQGRIGPKRNKMRVVLLGESAARGFLYDPQFTPAKALESVLESELGPGTIQVIDLARTNLGFELRELAIAALKLEPDVAVIFAGNNWRPFGARASFPEKDVPLLDGILRTEGIAGLNQLALDQLEEKARRLVRDVATAYQAKDVPLLWIVPEFNLGDWRDPVRNAPYLPRNANREWTAFQEQATAALQADDIEAAVASATRMVELDGGVSVAGLYLLAECSRRSGDLDCARRCLECARDALLWDTSIGPVSPRPYSVVQKALREEPLHFPRNQVLDLPEHFRRRLNGDLPDRRLFLDYCHLNVDAIKIAMAAAAACVIDTFTERKVDCQRLAAQCLSLAPKVEAEAAFLAAIHNAHWDQRQELVSYYCRQALKTAPEIAEVMRLISELQSRRHPVCMYSAAEKIDGMPWPCVQHYLFRMQNQQLDKVLLRAVAEALEETGISAHHELERVRREEHAFSVRPANLLDHYYCSAALQPQETVWARPAYSLSKESHYYKAYSRESKFCFVGEAHRGILLSLTCRLPKGTQGAIQIEVNGASSAEIAITDAWSTWEIEVPPEAARDGVNDLLIRWPWLDVSTQDVLAEAVENIRNKLLPEFYCTFGELHSFTASDAATAAAAFPAELQTEATLVAST
jgi:hypothetical protein